MLATQLFFLDHFPIVMFVVVAKIVDFQIKAICSMSEHENSAMTKTHSKQ